MIMSEIERMQCESHRPRSGILEARWDDDSPRITGNGFLVVLRINALDEAINSYGYGEIGSDEGIEFAVDDLIESLKVFKGTIRKDVYFAPTEESKCD